MIDTMSGYLFVMGFSNDADGALSDVTRGRVETAAQLHHRSPGLKVVVTGGHGDNFNRAPLPHRVYVNAALVERGVPAGSLEPDGFLSANTVEDAMMIVGFAADKGLTRIQVVTSAFHMARCALIFGCVAPELEIVFHAAPDPADVEPLAAHETRARAIILAQGGVMLGSRLYALPSL